MGWKAVTREPLPQCAHLGFAEDPFRRGPHATDEHRCYAHMGRERIDLAHQKRFCLTSAHSTCPFLLVNAREQRRDWRTEARGWWRTVSPAYQTLTATQLGQVVELGAAAAMRAYWGIRWAALTVWAMALQTWQRFRPQPVAAIAVAEETVAGTTLCAEPALDLEPVAIAAEPVTIAVETPPAEVVDIPVAAVVEKVPLSPPVDVIEYAPPQETAREWFWRAKNADTLDDLVECLERASALDPDNEMISFNLEWAKERRDAAKAKPKSHDTAPARPKLYSLHNVSPIKLALTALLKTLRTVVALATIAGGVVVVVGALPSQLRNSIQTPIDLPDTSGLVSLVHVPLAGGYDLGLALPYALGFLALFIGMGLLQREPSLAGRH